MLLSELTAVWQSMARPKAPREAARDDPRAHTPALVAEQGLKANMPHVSAAAGASTVPSSPVEMFSKSLLEQSHSAAPKCCNSMAASRSTGGQAGMQEYQQFNSWPQKRSGL